MSLGPLYLQTEFGCGENTILFTNTLNRYFAKGFQVTATYLDSIQVVESKGYVSPCCYGILSFQSNHPDKHAHTLFYISNESSFRVYASYQFGNIQCAMKSKEFQYELVHGMTVPSECITIWNDVDLKDYWPSYTCISPFQVFVNPKFYPLV
jgi:hypothetical protein